MTLTEPLLKSFYRQLAEQRLGSHGSGKALYTLLSGAVR